MHQTEFGITFLPKDFASKHYEQLRSFALAVGSGHGPTYHKNYDFSFKKDRRDLIKDLLTVLLSIKPIEFQTGILNEIEQIQHHLTAGILEARSGARLTAEGNGMKLPPLQFSFGCPFPLFEKEVQGAVFVTYWRFLQEDNCCQGDTHSC